MYKILNNQINQLNKGDVQGKLWNTFNCDLTTNKGKIGVSPVSILTTNTITNMGTPVGFKYFDSRYFTVAGTRVFKNGGTPIGAFSEDSSTNAPTDCSSEYSDLENFEDVLLVATDTTLWSKAANGSGTGAFTSRRTFSGGAAQNHPLCNYNKRAYWLDIGSPDRIYSMDSAYTVVTSGLYTMSLPSQYKVLWMRPFSNGIYIGTINKYGGQGLVFEWDGVSENKWNRAYKVYAQGALAGYVDGDTLTLMNSHGELLRFAGSRFDTIASFPYHKDLLYNATNISTNDRFIHPNGLAPINGYVCALINGRLNNTTTMSYAENIASGIWEYDEESKSFYHKYSMSYRTTAITITDYGQINLSKVGGLMGISDLFATAASAKGNFLAGAQFYTNASSTGYGIWTDSYYDTVEKSGFCSTVQIRAEHFTDLWNELTLLYNPTTNNQYVIKWRTLRTSFTDFDITWTGNTTFTTTQTGILPGYEIMIVQGQGSGRVAHVVSVIGTATFTVTLDETIVSGVSGTARARMQKWKKAGVITSETSQFTSKPIETPGTWVEIKVAMKLTGENALIEDLILDNKKQQ
jgi:hypothetical protein